MIERITEQLVVQAAREWAARKNKSDASAVANAQEKMLTLKFKLTDDEYNRELKKLYREYEKS
ncbi:MULTISPECIES: hypothetical protein [unclassified Pseudomonas]|uniref:hypothetical protein n=1 Tax=unclassified Pseudomonas TaxID=196821 RepID=UPI001912900E|nr:MULTISPECIES: hypothetical protein [unclassified Pseudomonas]MBK5416361.1 hypothetical protein [Pseudomonas sp. TH31]MEB0226270.1 hypothetical protein [Pseudomonas sp. 5S1]MEB0294909.1 hypothetical protein [Pseudomonas sp. 10S4]WPX18146.1 hypothetical protein RHM58_31105 [Pseudomonas sp. 10S4]